MHLRFFSLAACWLAAALTATSMYARDTNENPPATDSADPFVSLKFDLRFDGTYNHYGTVGQTNPADEWGFTGRYLKLLADGRISDRFSYSFRHRLYMNNSDTREFFSATDWAYITYAITPRLSVSAGKQVVLIGGYEYDKAPIDVYFWSDFWNNVNPYQIGITLGYTTPDGKHSLKAQVANSPFSIRALESILAYNLIWYGDFGWFKPIYSLNWIEYEKGHFINYIALGNKFMAGWWSWELDYMNRASARQENFFADFSLISRMDFRVGERFNLFAKGGYDQNLAQAADTDFAFDRYVRPGVKYWFWGAGIEYFPLAELKNTLRLHAFFYTNNKAPQPYSFNIGVRWRMKVWER